jgi:hypothetical protein
MADERFVVTVECSGCKTKQKVHVAITPGDTQYGPQAIQCISCKKYFSVVVSDEIMGVPFPA